MLIIGHRGARGLAPENTHASFMCALKNNVDSIELDIRTSADGKLVVHHDATVNGTIISKTDYTTLKHANPDLLLLHEALKILDGKCPVIIEIKKGADMQAVIDEFTMSPLKAGTQVASFDMQILRAVRSSLPDVPIIVNEKWSGIRGTHRCHKLRTTYLCMNQRWLWSGFIESLSKKGYNLSTYPLNDPKKANKWRTHGLYGVVTDYPDRF